MRIRFKYDVVNLRRFVRCAFISLLALLLYNEIFAYGISSLFWNDLRCKSGNITECTRILFVADPQILGENDSSSIEIWDNDRYLYITYFSVISHFLPHVVVFLGDIMDEGSIATDEQYSRYLERFQSIFNVEMSEMIYVPGDNDIGGELGDFITRQKVERFKLRLSNNQSDVVPVKRVSFYKVNRLTGEYPAQSRVRTNDTGRFVITHVPLMYACSKFVETVIDTILPAAIFSAHLHSPVLIQSSYVMVENRDVVHIEPGVNDVYTYNLRRGRLYEFIVPTCSYRMGVDYMGYGAAVYNMHTFELNYTVFWLPSRLVMLKWYLFASVFVLTITFLLCSPYIWRYLNRSYLRYYNPRTLYIKS